jgi:hypothetical protein
MAISSQILENYHGCGAYLVALDPNQSVIAIRMVPEMRCTPRPSYAPKIGRLSNVEKAARVRAEADYWRTVEAVWADWADDIRGWNPEGTATVGVNDMSCTVFCGVSLRLAWLAVDALANNLRLPIIPTEQRDRAYAAEARLSA